MEQIRRDRRNRTVRYPQNPIGRARKRWPRAYDGDIPSDAALRDRRGVETDDLSGPRTRSGFSLDTLRQSPVRSGLIGLAVAGTAAPIAINRYQQAMRTDPSHESLAALQDADEEAITDLGVSDAWETMQTAEEMAAAEREDVISESITKYSEYSLDRTLAENIYDAAVENDIDPNIAFGLVRAESSFRNTSTSPVGAVGLTQLMPKTAAWLEPGVTRAELREPKTNLKIGFKYLRQMIDKYEGDTKLALLAYNRGPGTVDRELKRGNNPDNGYADFVEGKEGHGHSLYTR